MAITIYPPSRDVLSRIVPKFALQQDRWNDYHFQTLYHLYYQPDADTPATMIGGVKILRRGQTESDSIQITDTFDELTKDFCSVGASLDYYQRLSELPLTERSDILRALRDVIALPHLQGEFEGEKGWRVSLFRDNPDHAGYLADAAAIYSNNFTSLVDLSASIAFQPAGWAASLKLDFTAPEPSFYFGPRRRIGPSGNQVLLPRRIIVLIGNNGSGKSTLLSRIARVAFASPSERSLKAMRKLGEFEPASIGFMRIIAISYSAFDNFIVPGSFDTDLHQIAADIEKGTGRYVYAGLRDIVGEARDDLDKARLQDQPRGDGQKVLDSEDRRGTTKLKSLDQLADEFVRLVGLIEKNEDGALLDAALEPLLSDASFVDVEDSTRNELLGDDPRAAFLSWSTGHKIALHVLASLVAHTTRKSIVLFDEPECHLHPPLVAALMNSMRVVLEEKDGVAVVATHSPVVLQETLARHVRIISRVGDHTTIDLPSRETFGESVGTLTQDTFGLTSASTDFHRTLDLLIEGGANVESINQFFTPALSGQALAYVMAGLARKAKRQ